MKLWWVSFVNLEPRGFRSVVLAETDATSLAVVSEELERRELIPSALWSGQIAGWDFDSDDPKAPDDFKAWLATAPRWKHIPREDLPSCCRTIRELEAN